ncbi:TPA: hypothetical protein ACH0PD_002848, partial [Legionella pneumophila]
MILFDIGIIKFRNQEVGGSTPLSGIVKSRLFPNYLSLDHIFINSEAILSPSTRSCKRNHPF